MATRWKILLALFGFILITDQVTKFWAVDRLTRAFEVNQVGDTLGGRVRAFFTLTELEDRRDRSVVVIRDHWQFKYVENKGAAWGILSRQSERLRVPFFHVVSVAAIVFILVFFRRLEEKQRLLQIALALVLGGAVGNFIDRLVRGYVIDFIDWHWKNDPALHWPTFNVADIGISVGVALMLGETLLSKKKPEKTLGELVPANPQPAASHPTDHAPPAALPHGADVAAPAGGNPGGGPGGSQSP